MPATLARVAVTLASATAVKSTGTTVVLALIGSHSYVTPSGKSEKDNATSPRKSAREALIRIACRFPFGTARA